MRLLLSFVGALLVALALFALMVVLVMPPQDDKLAEDELARVSFVRGVQDTVSDSRQRQRREAPERPEPPEPVPQTRPVAPQPQPAPEVNLQIEIPTVPASIQLSSAPTLAGIQAAETAPAPAPAPAPAAAAAQAPAPSAGPDISEELVMLVEVRPDYPRRAKSTGIEGKVTLQFTVNVDGRAENVRVVDADPPGVFDREARRAVIRSRYVPRRENGQPVAREATRSFVFRLEGAR